MRLIEIYQEYFSKYEREHIEDNLELFIFIREGLKTCHGIASLDKKIVELEQYIMFPMIYRLIELALLVPVVTTIIERAFSTTKIIKTDLRNMMSGGWLNYLMVCYIDRGGIFKSLHRGKIKNDFQKDDMALPFPRSSRHH